jgi:choline dehydrogenase-like flavoprotein
VDCPGFLEWESIPHAVLQPGIQIDNRANHLDAQADSYNLLLRDWVHIESVVLYAPVAKIGKFPYDGTVITASLLAMQNTYRGKITIASDDAIDHPLINPNFNTTETDHVVIRHGIRRILRLMQETSGGKDMVTSLIPEGTQAPLTTSSTDEDIDEHVKSSGHSWNHRAGTAAMEITVNKGEVDSKSRVHGVAGIRVVDASVLPVPIAAHYMVCVYALGWKIADLIADSCNEFQCCDVVFDSL